MRLSVLYTLALNGVTFSQPVSNIEGAERSEEFYLAAYKPSGHAYGPQVNQALQKNTRVLDNGGLQPLVYGQDDAQAIVLSGSGNSRDSNRITGYIDGLLKLHLTSGSQDYLTVKQDTKQLIHDSVETSNEFRLYRNEVQFKNNEQAGWKGTWTICNTKEQISSGSIETKISDTLIYLGSVGDTVCSKDGSYKEIVLRAYSSHVTAGNVPIGAIPDFP